MTIFSDILISTMNQETIEYEQANILGRENPKSCNRIISVYTRR